MKIFDTNDYTTIPLYGLINLSHEELMTKYKNKVLKDKGIDVLVIDHHEAEDGYSQNAVVINNQLSENYPNKQLSGVGMVYKFCKALDGILGLDFADSYLDLVALGNISDMVSMKSEETRYFVKKGLNNVVNPFLKALCEVYK